MKKCSKCNKLKSYKDFYNNKNTIDKLSCQCKECMQKYEQLHNEEIIKYRISHKQERKEYAKSHRKETKRYNAKYCKIHRIEINKHIRNKLKTNLNFKIKMNLRARIYLTLKGKSKSESTLKLLGCSLEFLKSYLQSKFQPGMSFSNYGKWHIDHIIPCAKFDLSKKSEQIKCFNYKNLQPLWAEENLKKSDKII